MTTGCLLLAAGWMLVGTLVTDTRSAAIIEIENGVQHVFREGDALANCSIGSIARNRVMLTCPSGDQHLSLDRTSTLSANRYAVTQRAAGPFSLPAVAFRALLADKQRLASEISLEPAISNGYIYGYRVAALRTGGELSQAGVQSGDIITQVNGAPANEPETFIQTIEALGRQPGFSLAIERGGVHLELSYVLTEAQ